MCQVVTEAGADFIKTSTGFSKAGATFDDIALFKKHVGDNVKIKAAGGIAFLMMQSSLLNWEQVDWVLAD